MLFLKVQSLAYGYSGVHVDTVQRLIDLYNINAQPRIYEMGSLGASGDLAPLAHLTLPLIGKGEVWFDGQLISGSELLRIKSLASASFKSERRLGTAQWHSVYERHTLYGVCFTVIV